LFSRSATTADGKFTAWIFWLPRQVTTLIDTGRQLSG
jgi:hypothetical protein